MGISKATKQGVELNREDVVQVVERLPFRDDFKWGASVAPHQVEGGLNGPDQPRNNWARWEEQGKVAKPGLCCDFSNRYAEDFDRAKGLGLGGFRLGIEWARVQPGTGSGLIGKPVAAPPMDGVALDHYAAMMAAAIQRGMTPVVTMQHFTHPEWLGADPWLDSHTSTEFFVPYVVRALEEINGRLIAQHGTGPLPYIVTINEPFSLAFATYGLGALPCGGKAGIFRRGLSKAATALENLYLAHVDAYQAIHNLYRQKGWAPPTVTVNGIASSVYEADFYFLDLLKAKQDGIPVSGLWSHMKDARLTFYENLAKIPLRRNHDFLRRRIERFVSSRVAAAFGSQQPFIRLTNAVLKAKSWRLNDVVSFDYYNPFYGDFMDFGFPALVKTRFHPWDWPLMSEALVPYLKMYSRVAGKLPVHILENGMAQRCTADGKSIHRGDGLGRSTAMRATLLEMFRAMGQGVNCGAFFYWSLLDNYEWGSFEPRFGLFGVGFDDPMRPRMETDIAGDAAAQTYREIVTAYGGGDKDALVQALMGNK